MKRLTTNLMMMLGVGALAVGCGGGGNGGGGGDGAAGADMAIAMATQDLAMPPPDLMKAGAASGEMCKADTDCAAGLGKSEPAKCLTTAMNGMTTITFMGGYCTTPCKVSSNDMNSGVNPDCPGGAGMCESDSGSTPGHCRSLCMGTADCRAGYACFYVDVAVACDPRMLSACDPNKAKSCPGVPMMPDGGAVYNDTCLGAGPDNDVGYCNAGCDPFAVAGCPMGDPNNADCHVWLLTGEGYCDVANTMPAAAGGACQAEGDCKPGYGCLSGKCWKYCHDDGKTVAAQCGVMNATCKPLDMSKVPATIAGICSMSN